MGERFLIDTNSLIDYLAASMPASGLMLMDRIFDSGDVVMSVISHIELLGFQAPQDYLSKCQALIDIAKVIPLLDLPTIEQAILIRRETKIKLPDAVVAATALSRNLTIISRNEKDFSRVAGLKFINPHNV